MTNPMLIKVKFVENDDFHITVKVVSNSGIKVIPVTSNEELRVKRVTSNEDMQVSILKVPKQIGDTIKPTKTTLVTYNHKDGNYNDFKNPIVFRPL